MILKRRDGTELTLDDYPALSQHLADPACHVADIVDQINGGIYEGVPICGRVMDMGANCGLFSAYASPSCDRIWAFEPSRRHFTAAEQFFREARIENVSLVHAALWVKDGPIGFMHDPNNATMDRIDYHRNAHTPVQVPCLRMDTLLSRYVIDHADFVKMDIEGAEEDVLASEGFAAAAPKIGFLWVECHNYRDWGDGKLLGDRVEALVRNHFPHVERRTQDLVIGRRVMA